jgi:hypothetical protein
MQPSGDTPAVHVTAHTEDQSICFEAHGFLNQSYDSVDNLLRDLVHHTAQPVDQASVTEVTVVGQPEGFLPFSHLFL